MSVRTKVCGLITRLILTEKKLENFLVCQYYILILYVGWVLGVWLKMWRYLVKAKMFLTYSFTTNMEEILLCLIATWMWSSRNKVRQSLIIKKRRYVITSHGIQKTNQRLIKIYLNMFAMSLSQSNTMGQSLEFTLNWEQKMALIKQAGHLKAFQ